MTTEVHKLVPASYLTLIKDNKVLLLLRANTDYEDGNYSMIAGHVEKKETFTDAMIREAKEEAGIKVKKEDLKVVHVMHRDSKWLPSKGKGLNERLDVFFITEKWEGEITNTEPHKCDGLHWFDLNNLPENIIPYIKHVLNCINKKVFYSEFGF